MKDERGLYIVLISVHGLTRGHNLELGRDPDTGGQTKYVVELARALIENPLVERVELMTRLVSDPKIDKDYAEPLEELAPGVTIVRLACGPSRYLRKEVLWPYLDSFTDHALHHIRNIGRVPDVIHSHYADAGYVGSFLASLLGVPLVHTGHSLGRVKKQRLLDQGMKEDVIENHYHMRQRIEAEEMTLDTASFIVTSTRQEVEEQYGIYDKYQPNRMVVIPPGVDLSRFRSPTRRWRKSPIQNEIEKFLNDPRKPMILALARADVRKNARALVQAFGENPELREMANLVIFMGNRDDIQELEKESQEVLTEFLYLVDNYNLYGSIAYPKKMEYNEVPSVYQIAARTHGVFVNPALTEPFGLTLIEAAASGLPIVATENGGPRDIVANCKNGILVDPLNPDNISKALIEALSDLKLWQHWQKSGTSGANRHYSWSGHVKKYLRELKKVMTRYKKKGEEKILKSHLPTCNRIIICDVDNTLIGDSVALQELIEKLKESSDYLGFGIATGRSLELTVRVLKEWDVPMPDFLVTSVGTELHYGPQLVEDTSWQKHIDYRWQSEVVKEALKDIPGLWLQPPEGQRKHKISYFIDPKLAPSLREIRRHLRKLDISVNVIYSHQAYLDVIPIRSSKGRALRYFADKWGFPLERILVAGDSGNDEEMLRGNTLGVVVGNHSLELNKLRGKHLIYFAKGKYAWGILEALEHYNFLGDIRIPKHSEEEYHEETEKVEKTKDTKKNGSKDNK
jgi:sucrose-phosphate synthase